VSAIFPIFICKWEAYGKQLAGIGLPKRFALRLYHLFQERLVRANADFRDKAPLSAAQAATIILDGVRSGAWRILVGEDAEKIDAAVRAKPESAYDYAELFSALAEKPAA
jgi:hypothetical protein